MFLLIPTIVATIQSKVKRFEAHFVGFAATAVGCYTLPYMVKSHAAPNQTPPSLRGGTSSPTTSAESGSASRNFIVMALNMSWQLVVVVLVPMIAGVELDKALKTSPIFLFVGLALAFVGSGFVMWRAMQTANRLPVPKLSDEQRSAIKKSYEEEDND
jgi:F0F1-type ATP synthase assembly protein I